MAEREGRLFHISTDYVFDGKKAIPTPYTEGEEPAPVSIYGKTKLGGETAVKSICPKHVIIRTAWLYGISGKNILKTFLRLALERKDHTIKVVNDQFESPTWSYRLAFQIQNLIDSESSGTYHATSEGYCSWYDLAAHFLKKMGVPHQVEPCTSEEYPTPSTRPKNSILENHRLKEAGINLMAHWKNDVDEFVALYKERLLKEVESKYPGSEGPALV